jgi:phytoene dehydrogenase-like protein
MSGYDVVVIGAGLGGLTAAAILARAGRKVLVIERNNSVGGAASSYKVGDLFVEGSLHETSDPNDPHDPKHHPLTRAGVLGAVKWIPASDFYEVRGGPLTTPLVIPDSFDGAHRALSNRFPDCATAIAALLDEMQATTTGKANAGIGHKRRLSLAEKLDQDFGDNEAVKCALAANLAYYHDDPATLDWGIFAGSQGRYLRSGARFIEGGSQRLSSALARAIRAAGGEVLLRRLASHIDCDANGRIVSVTHTARDGSASQTAACRIVVGNAAPAVLSSMLDGRTAHVFAEAFVSRPPSISLFTLTLGLTKPASSFGVSSYSTQLLPDWLKRLADYPQATRLMAEPTGRLPPLSIVDYSAIQSGIPMPPYVLSIMGPDHIDNWADPDPERYRAKRANWQAALIAQLDRHFPGIATAVIASAFNTAFSVRHYLNAPYGAVYGFAPAPGHSPRTPVQGLYLASAYAGIGGYTGAIQAGGTCADMVLADD